MNLCDSFVVLHLWWNDVKEEYYGREIIMADRDLVEQGSEQIFEDAKKEDIAFLVVGDPFG